MATLTLNPNREESAVETSDVETEESEAKRKSSEDEAVKKEE